MAVTRSEASNINPWALGVSYVSCDRIDTVSLASPCVITGRSLLCPALHSLASAVFLRTPNLLALCICLGLELA